jgi:hypothetical protein
MRASLGFRAGPLYIGTGDLLHTKRRKHSSGEILAYLIIAPILIIWFTGVVLWWLLAASWNGGVKLVTRRGTPTPADAEPADDPAWTPPTGRSRG